MSNGLQGSVTVKEEGDEGQDDLAEPNDGSGVSTLGIAIALAAPIARQVAPRTAGADSARRRSRRCPPRQPTSSDRRATTRAGGPDQDIGQPKMTIGDGNPTLPKMIMGSHRDAEGRNYVACVKMARASRRP